MGHQDSWSTGLGLVQEPTWSRVNEIGKGSKDWLYCVYSKSYRFLCVFCLRISLAMTSRVRTAPVLVSLFVTAHAVPCSACSPHVQPPCAPTQALEHIGALHPSRHWLLCQKCLTPTVSGASPLLPEQAGPVWRQADEPGSAWLHPSRLELLSCTLLACASCLAPRLHTWDELPGKEQGRGAPGGVRLPTGGPFGWGKHQQGEAEWWCWGSAVWGWALTPDWGKAMFLEQGWRKTALSSDICCSKHFWPVPGLKVLLPGTKSAFGLRKGMRQIP